MNRFFTCKSPKSLAMALFFAVLLCAVSVLTSAQSAPTAGYDLLTTANGASIDLTSVGLGVIPLQGVPIEGALGGTDTIMNRPGSTTFGQAQTLLVTALFMKSTNSVAFQGQNADVYVTMNNSAGAIPTTVLPQPDSLNASGGTITVNSGGTFTANFSVNADVIFVPHGSSVTNPNNYIAHQPAPEVTLAPATSTWSTTPPAGYPSSTTFPSGGFHPILPAHNGPHPVTPATCGGATGQARDAAARAVCVTQAQ